MKKPKKKINNGLIVMSKGERAAVIILLSVIAVLLAFSVFRPAIRFPAQEERAFHNLDSMIAAQERATRRKAEERRETKEQRVVAANTVGTGSAQIRPSNTGRPTETHGKTTSVADNPSPEKPVSFERKAIPILDINVADSTVLVELPQIGEVMASRIQRYRERLGGFVSLDQLYEVKGMDSARYATIKPYIVLENKEIRIIDVNRDEFKALLRHPYLEYEQVKAIVNHRERKGFIKDWTQLESIIGEANPLLKEYVGY